ncbi:DeoR/GlpR family DNA-binding transcription regulator [Albidovulum sp.]
MAETGAQTGSRVAGRGRTRKADRRRQILSELKLRPHLRISQLARRFNVSTETVRRDIDALADEGLVARDHGGATAPVQGRYPGFEERNRARIEERERIGIRAAELIRDGETVMIDSGSTTVQLARALVARGTQCTVLTNSIAIALTIGHGAPDVLLCPGTYLPEEAAVIGTETLEYLNRFNVDHCMIGASGLSADGPSETVQGFAAVKRVMLGRARQRHLLIDSQKFGRKGLARVGELADLDTVVVDRRPAGDLLAALRAANVAILVA